MLKETQIAANNYLIKQLPEATIFVNKKYEVVYASDKWVDDHGFEPNQFFGKTIDELFTQLSKEGKKTMRDCLNAKSNRDTVDYSLNTFSEDKWFKWTCKPWYDEKEDIIGLIINTEDITLDKLREERLEKLHSLLKITSEVGKIGSWEYNIQEDKLIWCNMTRKIHEVPDEFIPTLDVALNYYKEGYSKNTIAMVVHQAMEKGSPWSERLQLITHKGNEVWVQAAGMPIFKDDKLVSLTGTFQNIDDQVLSETESKKSETLMRTLIDNLPLNVFIKDIDSRKILVNKAECDYLGVENADDILGKSDFDLYDRDVAQISRDEDLMVLETLTPMLGKETISRTKDGKITTFLTSKIPLKGNNGKATGLVGISLDVSDMKRKEEELRDLINVTSLQNKKLINFAHIVSHNLRSHSANFSMLLNFLSDEKDESERLNIEKMLTDASDNLLETLENLNEVVAISTNINLEKKPVNLNEKIGIVQQGLSAFLKNSNTNIINTISDTAEVKVVPAYIESILMNFITNAVKYKDPNRNPIIRLSASKSKGYTLLSIADNGLGIDLEKYGDKLFGMYKT
ncbi:MAG: PAS domain-containing protein, partial [Pricia sp.]|nr:PAS domain-containing protein [Pricia sp.]